MNLRIKKPRAKKLIVIVFVFLAGVGVGSLLPFNKSEEPVYQLASLAERQNAKQQIVSKYLDASSTKCNDSSDSIKPTERVQVFYNYLKINSYANRAVIRGCSNHDSLLVKNDSGDWAMTDVNLNLDTRANPKWQTECMIQDITTADDQVRPENSSIDSFNFEQCSKLNN